MTTFDRHSHRRLTWTRSRFCSNAACVEVARSGDEFIVRDSKNGDRLTYTAAEWQAFLDGVRAGDFDNL